MNPEIIPHGLKRGILPSHYIGDLYSVRTTSLLSLLRRAEIEERLARGIRRRKTCTVSMNRRQRAPHHVPVRHQPAGHEIFLISALPALSARAFSAVIGHSHVAVALARIKAEPPARHWRRPPTFTNLNFAAWTKSHRSQARAFTMERRLIANQQKDASKLFCLGKP